MFDQPNTPMVPPDDIRPTVTRINPFEEDSLQDKVEKLNPQIRELKRLLITQKMTPMEHQLNRQKLDELCRERKILKDEINQIESM